MFLLVVIIYLDTFSLKILAISCVFPLTKYLKPRIGCPSSNSNEKVTQTNYLLESNLRAVTIPQTALVIQPAGSCLSVSFSVSCTLQIKYGLMN